jgi:hypothetical protein
MAGDILGGDDPPTALPWPPRIASLAPRIAKGAVWLNTVDRLVEVGE